MRAPPSSDVLRPRAPRDARPPRLPAPTLQTEELGVLRDFRGRLGHFLWQALRDVNLWALGRERDQLFAAGAAERRLAELEEVRLEAPAIAEPLYALSMVLALPTLVDAQVVHRACWRVAEWAEEQGGARAALAFGRCAMRAAPAARYEAEPCYQLGRLLRERGEYGDAEQWFHWTLRTARTARDHRMYAWGHSALGNLYRVRGSYPRAVHFYRRFLSLSRRHRFLEWQGMALHSLFATSLDMGRARRTSRLARGAFAAYRETGSALLPVLAHDVGIHWIEQGEFARAQRVLESVWPHLPDEQRLNAAANLVRAAGSTRDRAVFDRFWDIAVQRLSDSSALQRRAQIYLGLARGAASLSAWEEARQMGRGAAEIAARFGEHSVRWEAEALLQAVEREETLATAHAPDSADVARQEQHFEEELCGYLTHLPAGA